MKDALDFVALNQYQELALRTESPPDLAMAQRIANVGKMLFQRLEVIALFSKEIEDIKRYIFYGGQRKDGSVCTDEAMIPMGEANVLMLTPEQIIWIRDMHALVGVIGEIHEMVERFDKNPLSPNILSDYVPHFNKKNIAEEFGDTLWYTALGLDAVGIPMLLCARANISKLRERYPGKFTSEAAAERDLVREDSALVKELSHGSE